VQPGYSHATEAEGVPPVVEMTVRAAVQRDLDGLAKRDPKLAQSGLAASALALATEMDAGNSATSKSMCARALVETLEKLESMAPAAPTADAIDQLAAKREKRKAAG
jgi:hypothetical protein